MNEDIRISECRLIDDEGTQYGIVSIAQARALSLEKGLDLIEVSPTAKPPVVKLMDYGKFKYDLQKKANENKKKQAVIQLKEIQFRPNIEAHDLETKLRNARRFLQQGDKIKMVMQFRGREMAYKDTGKEKFMAIISQVEEMGATIESEAKMMGTRIIVIVAPDKKKMKMVVEKEKEQVTT